MIAAYHFARQIYCVIAYYALILICGFRFIKNESKQISLWFDKINIGSNNEFLLDKHMY